MNRRCFNQDGPKNTNWKGGTAKSTIERLTRRILEEAGRDLHTCERCNQTFTHQELPRHHKDHDRSNNAIENLEVVCWGCHNIEHNKDKPRNALGQFQCRS